MELIPIIKLAVIIFATVVFFIILISYMVYKAKEKKQVRPWNKKNSNETESKSHLTLIKNEKVNHKNHYADNSNKEQLYFVPQREVRRIPVLAHSQSRSSQRFKVVNEQQLNYKIYETRAERPRTFYHPNELAVKAFSFQAPSGNILDSYSLSNEPLRKLAIK